MQDASTIIARQLTQDDQAKRIYKLLIYVSAGTWIGEIPPPSEALMQRALDQVLQQFAEYGELRSYLHTSINKLSKPAEYSEIADTILETIAQANGINGDEPTTTFLPVPPNLTLNEQGSIYSPIAAHLISLPNQIRLKKLAFCVAQSIWEGDVTKLEALSWLELTHTLHQRYPNHESLYKAFQQVVSRLSKPIEYSMLAEALIESIDPLYEESPTEAPNFTPGERRKNVETQPSSAEMIAPPQPSPELSVMPVTMIPSAPWSKGGKDSMLVEAIDSVIFDLHHDIIKQSNSLRLKHLLLILISHLEPDEAIDGMNLRQQTTIPLLSVAFRIHRKPEILAIKLREIARRLPDPEEYENTIEAIVRAFRVRIAAQLNSEATTQKRSPLINYP